MNDPIWKITGFQQQDRQDWQILNNDTFCRLPVTSFQYIFGTERNPDGGILIIFDDDDYTKDFVQIKEDFTPLTMMITVTRIYQIKISDLRRLGPMVLVII